MLLTRAVRCWFHSKGSQLLSSFHSTAAAAGDTKNNPGRTRGGAERLFSAAEVMGGGGGLPAENNGVKCDKALLPERSHQEENPETITAALAAISAAKLAPNLVLSAGG